MKPMIIAVTVIVLVITVSLIYRRNGGKSGHSAQPSGPSAPSDPVSKPCQGTWSPWTACSASCGGGTQSQFFTVDNVGPTSTTGSPCPTGAEQTRTRPCNTDPCPKDCQVGPWGNWSPCTESCGQGITSRVRSVIQPQVGDGYPCPSLVDTQICNPQPCTQPCVLSDWSDWSECSVPCTVKGTPGLKSHSRTILTPPVGNDPSGKPYICDVLYEEINCTSDECPPCPESCNLSDWDEWSSCVQKTATGDIPVTCGGGVQTRTRTVLSGGTETCPLHTETRPCNTEPCPIDCILSDWSNPSECDQPCGGGQSIQTRTILQFPNSTGKSCLTVAGDGLGLIKTAPCNDHICDGSEPRLSEWSEWSECKAGCGNNEIQTRTRTIIDAATYKGGYDVIKQEKPCENTEPCPVDCVVSDWLYPSACSTQCGPGTRFRWKEVIQQPNSNGKQCPPLFEEEDCPQCAYIDGELVDPSCTANKNCPIDCVIDAEWTDDVTPNCTNVCDTDGIPETKTQHKNILVHPQYGGEACGETTRTVNCASKPLCAKDCQGNWGGWGECSEFCGGGTQTNQFNISPNGEPNAAGKPCPSPSLLTQACNTQPCKVDCVPGPWSDWDIECPLCGLNVTRHRTRSVVTPSQGGGAECVLDDYQKCDIEPCQNCQLSDWSAWSSCSLPCGTGVQTREKDIISQPGPGGVPCESLVTSQTQNCNTMVCPSCQNGTVVNTTGVPQCSCQKGWAGPLCQYGNATTCNGRGIAQDDGTCSSCSTGWAGLLCQYGDSTTCNGRGTAHADGTCTCNPSLGYTGPTCATPPKDCSVGGWNPAPGSVCSWNTAGSVDANGREKAISGSGFTMLEVASPNQEPDPGGMTCQEIADQNHHDNGYWNQADGKFYRWDYSGCKNTQCNGNLPSNTALNKEDPTSWPCCVERDTSCWQYLPCTFSNNMC
jgi:hypothetical protein